MSTEVDEPQPMRKERGKGMMGVGQYEKQPGVLRVPVNILMERCKHYFESMRSTQAGMKCQRTFDYVNMRPDSLLIIIQAKMDDGCVYEATAWGTIKEAKFLGIPKSMIEIEMMRFRIEQTKHFQCPFQGVLTSEESLYQREEPLDFQEIDDYFERVKESKQGGRKKTAG